MNSLSGSAGNQYAKSASPVTELDQLDNSLNASLASIHSVNSRLRAISDRLFGPQPEAVGTNSDPKPHCTLSKLNSVSGYIGASVDELTSLVARLERL